MAANIGVAGLGISLLAVIFLLNTSYVSTLLSVHPLTPRGQRSAPEHRPSHLVYSMQPPQETGIHESALLPNHVFQTILEAPHGNALQACAASILGLPLGDMPNFVDASDYWAAMLAHARLLNLGLIKVPLTENGQLPYPSAPGTLCLARGNSPRGPQGHVVVAAVAADGTSLKLVHDPWPNGLGLDGPASWAAFYTALSPATVAKASLACEDASESSASTKSVFQTNTVDPALPALPSSALSSATSHPPPMASPVPRSSRVAFIGNSYVYYNDLPRLLETLAGPTVLARTGVCLRGGASLPGLMGPRGGSANVLPGSDVAGLGVGSTPVGTVRDLLVGGEGAAHVPPAPPADPGTKDSKAAASFAPASAIDKEGTAHPESGLWDTVVLNDYSQAAALPTDRAQTEKCLREQYAPLFVAAKSVRMVVFYVPPAYRAHTKGSEQIGYEFSGSCIPYL